MGKLVTLRHGQSVWNKRNIFTGWVDVALSEKGVEEALQAGSELASFAFDAVFVSSLERAQMTAFLALSKQKQDRDPVIVHEEGELSEWSKSHGMNVESLCLPVYISSALNERYYGKLQGMNKDMARETFGEEQVHIWRRSFAQPPPEGESLEMTAKRTLPYFRKRILPLLKEGKTVLISAHGNSLRSIVMEIESLSEKEVLSLELATGKPRVYTLGEDGTLYRDDTFSE